MAEAGADIQNEKLILSPAEVGAKAYGIIETIRKRVSGLPEFIDKPDFFTDAERQDGSRNTTTFTLDGNHYSLSYSTRSSPSDGTNEVAHLTLFRMGGKDEDEHDLLEVSSTYPKKDSEIYTNGSALVTLKDGSTKVGTAALSSMPDAFGEFFSDIH